MISRQNKLVSIDIKDMSQFLFFEIWQKKNTVTTGRVYGIIIIKRKKENTFLLLKDSISNMVRYDCMLLSCHVQISDLIHTP